MRHVVVKKFECITALVCTVLQTSLIIYAGSAISQLLQETNKGTSIQWV